MSQAENLLFNQSVMVTNFSVYFHSQFPIFSMKLHTAKYNILKIYYIAAQNMFTNKKYIPNWKIVHNTSLTCRAAGYGVGFRFGSQSRKTESKKSRKMESTGVGAGNLHRKKKKAWFGVEKHNKLTLFVVSISTYNILRQ